MADGHGTLVMAVEKFGETTSWSRLGFKLYLVMERQFS